jgi:hypothetical protein
MFTSKASLVSLAIATATLIQTTNAPAQQPKRQSSGAVKYPATIAPFKRQKITNFTRDGANSSGTYTSKDGHVNAYVYPARAPYSPSLPTHFEQCRREIRMLWARPRTISRRSISISRNGRQYPGMEEVFSGAPLGTGESVSTLTVFKANDRYVKFRITSPIALRAQQASQLAAFIQKFPFP